MASIFSDASVAPAQDPLNCHTLTHAASAVPAPNVTAGAAWLSSDGEALFAMATDAGTVLLVKLPRVGIAGEFLCLGKLMYVLHRTTQNAYAMDFIDDKLS